MMLRKKINWCNKWHRLCALSQQMGQIIVFASIMDNVQKPKVSAQGDSQRLVNRPRRFDVLYLI